MAAPEAELASAPSLPPSDCEQRGWDHGDSVTAPIKRYYSYALNDTIPTRSVGARSRRLGHLTAGLGPAQDEGKGVEGVGCWIRAAEGAKPYGMTPRRLRPGSNS